MIPLFVPWKAEMEPSCALAVPDPDPESEPESEEADDVAAACELLEVFCSCLAEEVGVLCLDEEAGVTTTAFAFVEGEDPDDVLALQ